VSGKIQQFDFSVDLLQTLLWQYNDAEKLQSLLQYKQDWVNTNQTEFWNNWYTDVFDLRTANDFGLSVWSIILGLPVFATIYPNTNSRRSFAFGGLRGNYGTSNFLSTTTGNLSLTTQEKRIALRIRYFQLVTRGCVLEINRFFSYLFGDGNAYALDGLNMTMMYIFRIPISPNLLYVFQTFDILPRPATVGLEIRLISGSPFAFGPLRGNYFYGNYYSPTLVPIP
jgi:hypothetical protein